MLILTEEKSWAAIVAGWTARCRMSAKARFSALVQTGPGVHLASCTISTGLVLGVNWPGRGVDPPSPPSAEVKKE
jgi:hypothetical protein